MLNRPARSSRAFTMLELIVVIVILGILALLAIPTFQSVIDRTRKSTLTRTAEGIARNIYTNGQFDGVPGNNIDHVMIGANKAEIVSFGGYTATSNLTDVAGGVGIFAPEYDAACTAGVLANTGLVMINQATAPGTNGTPPTASAPAAGLVAGSCDTVVTWTDATSHWGYAALVVVQNGYAACVVLQTPTEQYKVDKVVKMSATGPEGTTDANVLTDANLTTIFGAASKCATVEAMIG